MSTELINGIFPEIETSRLILKEIVKKNDKEIFDIFSDKEVMKYYDIEPLDTIEAARKLIQMFDRRFMNKKGIRWGIFLKSNNQLIGTCGYQSVNKQSLRAEIGYELLKKYWKKGLMKEALQAIIEFGFNEMSFNRIQALVEPENRNSIYLLHRIGFKEEGVLKEYEFYKEKYVDLTMLSLLKINCDL